MSVPIMSRYNYDDQKGLSNIVSHHVSLRQSAEEVSGRTTREGVKREGGGDPERRKNGGGSWWDEGSSGKVRWDRDPHSHII